MRGVGLFIILFFCLLRFSFSQQHPPSFISDYYSLLSSDRDHTLLYCDSLISSGQYDRKTFGYAGKGHIATLKADFEEADKWLGLAQNVINNFSVESSAELKGHVLYLNALRLINTHELEEAINLLMAVTRDCAGNCSVLLETKVESGLARSYSLSGQSLKVLQISHRSIKRLENALTLTDDINLKQEYANQLFNAGLRSFHVYLSDTLKYKNYLDSIRSYTQRTSQYAKQNKMSSFDGKVILMNADIYSYTGNYAAAQPVYQQAFDHYTRIGRKKRVEQISFRLGECAYHLGQYDSAERVFQRQIEEKVWLDYQLLQFYADCYYYLIDISDQKGDTKLAMLYATQYGQKLSEYYKTKNESDLKVNDLSHLESRAKEIQTYVDNYDYQIEQKKKYIFLSVLLIVFIVLFWLYYLQVNRKKLQNIRELNDRINELKSSIERSGHSNSSLTDENAKALLQKLRELESKELYLKSDYNLNMVAQKLGTNTSYLSKTVNQYLGLSFAEYSNQLKVNAIINKLKEHRQYRNYTIDALAQEAGYKSVNSFNSNFKKLLKVSPSQYLKELNKV